MMEDENGKIMGMARRRIRSKDERTENPKMAARITRRKIRKKMGVTTHLRKINMSEYYLTSVDAPVFSLFWPIINHILKLNLPFYRQICISNVF